MTDQQAVPSESPRARRRQEEVTVLPVDLQLLERLNTELNSSSPSGETVSRLVFQDPAFAIALCQNAYAVQQGVGDPFSVTSPWQMIVRLGMERVKQLLAEVAQRPQPPATVASTYAQQRRLAVRIAEFSRVIAKTISPQLAEAGELMGLLGGIGSMLGTVVLRERYVALMEQTPNHAKANYRLLKECNFSAAQMTSECLRLNGIPERFVATTDRDARVPGAAAHVELRAAFLSAVELSNAFDDGRIQQYAPGKALPANSALRLLQFKEPTYLKLFTELEELVKGPPTAAPLSAVPIAPAQPNVAASPEIEDDESIPDSPAPISEPEPAADELLAEEDLSGEDTSAELDVQPETQHPGREVRPIGELQPSEARVKRIQRLRARGSSASVVAAPPVSTTPEGLKVAASAIAPLIKDNPMITSCIRSIRNAEMLFSNGNLGKVRDLTVQVIKPLSHRASRYQAALYFAAKRYYGHLFCDRDAIDLDEAIAALLPSETAAIIALTYLLSQLEPHCEPDIWQGLERTLRTQIEIGRMVGATAPELSGGTGMIVAGVRYMAHGIFLARGAELYAEHLKELTEKKVLFDLETEQRRFGATNLDLSALLLQRLGFGVQLAHEFLPLAFDPPKDPIPLLACWVESIYLSRTPLAAREYAPALGVQRSEVLSLRDKLEAMFTEGTPSPWLGRDKADLNIDGCCRLPNKKNLMERSV